MIQTARATATCSGCCLEPSSETALETSQQCLAVPRKTAGFEQATEKPHQREERESAPKLIPAPNNMK